MEGSDVPRWMRVVSVIADVLLSVLRGGSKRKRGSSSTGDSSGDADG